MEMPQLGKGISFPQAAKVGMGIGWCLCEGGRGDLGSSSGMLGWPSVVTAVEGAGGRARTGLEWEPSVPLHSAHLCPVAACGG